MSNARFPWSFYSTLLTFAVFFFSLNVYIITILVAHPFASNLWLVGVFGGGIGFAYSLWMVYIHQKQLIEEKSMTDVDSTDYDNEHQIKDKRD